MISRREPFFKELAVAMDMVLITVSFFTASRGMRLFLLPVCLALWVGLLSGKGAYRRILSPKPLRKVLAELFQANLLGAFMLTAGLYLLKMSAVSRAFVLLFVGLNLFLLSAGRIFLLVFIWAVHRRGFIRKNVLVVGTGPRAHELIWRLSEEAHGGVKILGVLDVRPELVGSPVGDLDGVKVIGTLDGLPAVLRSQPVDEVIFVVPRKWMERIETAVRECELAGVCATVAMDLFNIRLAKAQPSLLCGIPVLSLYTTPPEGWKLAVKRLIDIAVSGACLLVLSPLFLVTAVAIKATSPGPVFFRQTRIGLNGRRFTLYKFRSMTADAERRRAEVEGLNEMVGPAFKAENDPRLTPVGKRLRRWSIDELPQLYNVLRGEMSLVGPRPPLPGEVERYERWQSRRLSVKPGVTGYWQVNGRNRIRDFEKWARLDLEYIDRWSLGFDMKILLKTIPAVVSGAGAK